MDERKTAHPAKHAPKITHNVKRAVAVSKPPQIGSAAADWSRWPAGTTFRLLSTGQSYRVEDYGWALSGRNTIDLYMPNQREMNSWGARQETIEILKWGDPRESLQFLQRHQDYRHIKRMVLRSKAAKKKPQRCGNKSGLRSVSRIDFGVAPTQALLKTRSAVIAERQQSSRWRDTMANTPDGCAPRKHPRNPCYPWLLC